MYINIMGLYTAGQYERYKALDCLYKDGEQSGRELREKINNDLCTATQARRVFTRMKLGALLTLTLPAFYQLMADLEKADQVEGWYRNEEIEDITIKQRWYRLKEGGIRVLQREEIRDAIPKLRIGWASGS